MRVAGQPHTRCRSVTSTHHVVQRVLGDRGYAPAKLTRTVAGGCAAGWCGRGAAREPPTPGTRARWRPGTPRVAWARTTASDAHSAKQSADARASDLPVGVPHARLVGPVGIELTTRGDVLRRTARARLRLQQLELGRTWRPVSDGILPSILPKPGLLAAGRERHRTDNQPRPGARRRSDRGAGATGVEGHYGPFIQLMKSP